MEIVFLLSLFVVIVFIALRSGSKKKKKRISYLYGNVVNGNNKAVVHQAVDIQTLLGRTRTEQILNKWANLKIQVGKLPEIKIFLFISLLLVLANFFNENFIGLNIYVISLIFVVAGCFMAYSWMQKQERNKFEDAFPVALNMLASAISSGESITHAIMYVGQTLDGPVADEFKLMAQRLQMGEPPESVFTKSCNRFPYPSFLFFVITLRANMERGGQLKDIIQRLNRLMFNNKAMEKKKLSMTSEARMSAKIVAAIPFIFLFSLKYISPDNFEYVMNDPSGRMILYYMLISEFIGIAIIWGLMKSVR